MRDGYKVLDSDGHVLEPTDIWEKYIEPEFKDRAPTLFPPEKSMLPGFDLEVEGKRLPNLCRPEDVEREMGREQRRREKMEGGRYDEDRKTGFDAATTLKAMDQEGIDMVISYPSVGFYAAAIDGMDAKLAAAVCRAYNKWLFDFCQTDPQRLKGVAMVALQDVELAIIEARRAVTQLGMVGIVVRPNPVNGRNPHDPYYEPLYSELEQLKVPLGIHESIGHYHASVAQERFLGNYLMTHAATHPIEQMLAMESFILGGVLERHPELTVLFLESGCSWLPYWLWRMDEEYELYGEDDVPYLKAKPSEYFLRQCYIGAEVDEPLTKYVVDWLGDDRLLWASDYPHDDGKYPLAVKTFLELPGLSQETKKKILWDNPMRAYPL